MISFLPSTFWFIIAGFCGVIGVVCLMGFACMSDSIPYGNIYNTLKSILWAAVSMLLLAVIFLACGYRAPDYVHKVDVSVDNDFIANVVKEEVDLQIKELADAYKYKILTESK